MEAFASLAWTDELCLSELLMDAAALARLKCWNQEPFMISHDWPIIITTEILNISEFFRWANRMISQYQFNIRFMALPFFCRSVWCCETPGSHCQHFLDTRLCIFKLTSPSWPHSIFHGLGFVAISSFYCIETFNDIIVRSCGIQRGLPNRRCK